MYTVCTIHALLLGLPRGIILLLQEALVGWFRFLVVWLNSAVLGGPALRSDRTLRFPRRDLRRVVLQPGVYLLADMGAFIAGEAKTLLCCILLQDMGVLVVSFSFLSLEEGVFVGVVRKRFLAGVDGLLP